MINGKDLAKILNILKIILVRKMEVIHIIHLAFNINSNIRMTKFILLIAILIHTIN